MRRRDLLILKYDKQRSLCDEIILRQQKLIEGINRAINQPQCPEKAPFSALTITFTIKNLLKYYAKLVCKH